MIDPGTIEMSSAVSTWYRSLCERRCTRTMAGLKSMCGENDARASRHDATARSRSTESASFTNPIGRSRPW